MTETTAAQRGWGSGWPNCQSSKMVTIHPCGRALPIRREAATVFDYLVRRFDAEIEDINAHADDWGYSCRPIRGTNRPSNHSWGLAVDLNSLRHPQGSAHTFTSTQLLNGHLMLGELHFFRWGQDYSGTVDGMHWEFMGTPTDMAALTRRVKRLLAWPVWDGHVLKAGMSNDRTKLVNNRLGFGPTSVTLTSSSISRLRGFQSSRHLPVTGVVDAATWKRLAWRLA